MCLVQVDCDGEGNLTLCFNEADRSVQRAQVFASCRAPTTCSIPSLAESKAWVAGGADASATVSVHAREGGWDSQCRCLDGATPFLMVQATLGRA